MWLPLLADAKTAKTAIGEGAKMMLVILCAIIAIFFPAITMWVLVRLIAKGTETTPLRFLFFSLIFLAVCAACFFGEKSISIFLTNPSFILHASWPLYLRLAIVLIVVFILVYSFIGVGMWLRSVAITIIFLVLSYLLVRGLHLLLSKYDAYKVLTS